MSTPSYFEKAKPLWDELGALLDKAHRQGVRSLSAEELSRLDRLYRTTTVHLAQARLRTTHRALVEHLNRLVGRAHSLIYAPPRRNPLTRFLRFYADGFARAVARTARFHGASLALFTLGALFAYRAALYDETFAYALLGDDVRLPGSSVEQLESVLRGGRDMASVEKFGFASFLFTHNTRVGFMAFAAGILCGIPTVFLMVMNGGVLGAFTAVHHRLGVRGEMWAWILPHGITEIAAVILCGGAGLMLGAAVLRPGLHTRGHSLLEAGREAVRLVLGVVPMFVLAGFIESYIRQSHLSVGARFLFAATTAAFWLAYFYRGAWREIRARRRMELSPPPSSVDL